MSKNGIRVEEFNIYSLGAEAVSYHLKDIHTLALEVKAENIGGLSLELETELNYTADGEPSITIAAARGPKEEPENDRMLTFRPSDWIVILWDEIHRFRDTEFRSTFSFDELKVPRMTDAPALVEEMNEHYKPEETGGFVPQVSIPIGNMIREAQAQIRNMDIGDVVRGLVRHPPVVGEAVPLYPEGDGPSAETTQIVPSVGTVEDDKK